MKKNFFGLTIILVLIAFWLLSVSIFPFMPEQMISHWGLNGQPDGFMNRTFGLLLVPILVTVLTAVFLIIRTGESVKSFRAALDRFLIALLLFVFYIQAFVLLWNLGSEVPVIPYFTALFGVLWYAAGALMAKSEPNPWVGIRMPWTFENKKVWDKTHRLAGSGMKLAALLAFATALTPEAWAFWLVIIPPLAVFLVSIIYSYSIRRTA